MTVTPPDPRGHKHKRYLNLLIWAFFFNVYTNVLDQSQFSSSIYRIYKNYNNLVKQ